MLSSQSFMPAGAGTPGYENWVHWLMEGSGVVWATHPTPSWGQDPALHSSCDPWAVVVQVTVVGVAGRRRNSSRIGVRDMLSYQSVMPAVAGTPRYENWVHWLMEGSGVVCAAHPAPSWGQAPALHFSCDPGQSLFR